MRNRIWFLAALALLAACKSKGGATDAGAATSASLSPPAAATVATPAAAAGACQQGPAPLAVKEPERDLTEVEKLAGVLKKASMGGVCAALTARNVDALRKHFTDDARVQRLLPRAEEVLVHDARTHGSLVRPRNPACFGTSADLVADLRALTDSWLRVERCFFKSFRIFATREKPRSADVELHFWWGGTLPGGGRSGEKGDVRATMVEGADGAWRFSRLEWRDREHFTSTGTAFADWTERAGLPTDWVDVGYPPTLSAGQVLHGGVSIGDFDGDGWNDLYVARAGQNFLLRNDGKGGFVDVTAKAGVGDLGNGQAAAFADLDNDGDQDLIVINASYSLVKGGNSHAPSALYRNNGDGTFTRMPGSLGPIGPASGVAVADYDGDGLLDIYLVYYQDENLHQYHHSIEAKDGFGNRLLRNKGNLQFEDVTQKAGVGGHGWSYAATWADVDGDGRPDLYVANDYGDSDLYRNKGDGTFENIAKKAGVANEANGMSADFGDFDNDGLLDLYVANMYSKTGNQFLALYPDLDAELRRKLLRAAAGNSLYRNRGDGTFEELGIKLGVNLAGWAWGSNFFDYDNDGWLDIHVANGLWSGEVESDA